MPPRRCNIFLVFCIPDDWQARVSFSVIWNDYINPTLQKQVKYRWSSVNRAVFVFVLNVSASIHFCHLSTNLLTFFHLIYLILLFFSIRLQLRNKICVLIDYVWFFGKVGFRLKLFRQILNIDRALSLRKETFVVRCHTVIELRWSWLRLCSLLAETRIEDFLIVVFHDIESKFDGTIWDISKCRFRNASKRVSPHIVNSFELFIFDKFDLRGRVLHWLIIILDQFIADRIFEYVCVESVKVSMT